MKFNTQLLHGNAIKRYPDGATLPPISQVSAFAYETAQDLEKVFKNPIVIYKNYRSGVDGRIYA